MRTFAARWWRTGRALALTGLLTACGGGGGGGGTTAPPPAGGATGVPTKVEVEATPAVSARGASNLFTVAPGLRPSLPPLGGGGGAFTVSVGGQTVSPGGTVPLTGTSATLTVSQPGATAAHAALRLPGVTGQRARLRVAAENGTDLNQNGTANDLLLWAIVIVDTGDDGTADSLYIHERLPTGATFTRSVQGIRFVDINGDGVLNTADGDVLMADQDNDGISDITDTDDDGDGLLDGEDTDDDNDGIADDADTQDTDNDNDGTLNFADPDFTDGLFPSVNTASLAQVKTLVQENFWFREQLPANLNAFTHPIPLTATLNDVYSAYLTAPELTALTQNLSGIITGIGVVLTAAEGGGVQVAQVLAGSGAVDAGVQVGDRIVGVGGLDTSAATTAEAAGLIRGAANTTVFLTLERGTTRLNLIVQRRVLTFPLVSSVDEGGGVLRVVVNSYGNGVAQSLRNAVAAAAPATGVIVDLRGNPGGLVNEATSMADDFLSSGTIVTLDLFNGADQVTNATQSGADTQLPLVVLVDGGSASASEIFCAAIKENNRGRIVGQTTFGKGIVQFVYTLPAGDGLKLTTAAYLTPQGNNIHGIGVSPTDPVAQGTDPVPVAKGLLTNPP